MHLLVTRPEPDATDLKVRLEAAGHRVSVEPLIRIEHAGLGETAFAQAQGLIVTSRNALRAVADDPRLDMAKGLPLFVVGPQTEELARALGFTRARAAAGSARELLPVIAAEVNPAAGPLVHLSGDHVACDLVAALAGRGIEVARAIVYRSIAADALSPGTAATIASGEIDGVLLMSPRTAATYAQLIAAQRLAPAARGLVHLCLSPAVADRLTSIAPQRIEIARGATSEQMLALVAEIAPQSVPRSL